MLSGLTAQHSTLESGRSQPKPPKQQTNDLKWPGVRVWCVLADLLNLLADVQKEWILLADSDYLETQGDVLSQISTGNKDIPDLLTNGNILSAARTVVTFFFARDVNFLLRLEWLVPWWGKSGRERRVLILPSDALLS